MWHFQRCRKTKQTQRGIWAAGVEGQRHVHARLRVSPPCELTLRVFPQCWTGCTLFWAHHHLRGQRPLCMLAPEPTNHPIPQNPQRHVVMAAITAPGESPDYHFQMIRPPAVWQEGGPGPARPGMVLHKLCAHVPPFSEWKSWVGFFRVDPSLTPDV